MLGRDGRPKWLAGGKVGTEDPPKMVIGCHHPPYGGETLVTDGRVDDRLVWWFQHSKQCAWSPVRVPPATLSSLLTERRVVVEQVQLEVVQPDEIAGDETDDGCHPWLDDLG